jgi:hypothetical protein
MSCCHVGSNLYFSSSGGLNASFAFSNVTPHVFVVLQNKENLLVEEANLSLRMSIVNYRNCNI